MDAWIMAIDDTALEALPLAQREVVRLARDEQLDEAAIADRLNIPQGMVASRLFRARMMVSAKPSVAKKTATKAKKVAAVAASTPGATPLPTLQEVEKDLAGLRSLKAMLDGSVNTAASSLPTLDEVKQDVERLKVVQTALAAPVKKTPAVKSAEPTGNPNAAMLKSIAEDRARLASLHALLDEAAREPAPEAEAPSASRVASLRARLEKDIPGYTAAVQAAEQQLRQAKAKLATA